MYPTFNLYLSILGGSWHPGLLSCRSSARFERLLQAVHPVNGCGCSAFFRQLADCLGEPLQEGHPEIRSETLRLVSICGCGGSNEFINLPASGARERFYNLLTGYCLDSYEQWIIRVLQEHRGSSTGKWIHYRLTGQLRALLALPVAWRGLPTEGLLIVCRTKAATAILLHRMHGTMPVRQNGFRDFLLPREELKTALAVCDLALPARQEVLALYDRATACSALPAPRPDGNIPATAPAGPDRWTADSLLARLMREVEKDDKPFRQQLRELAERHKRQSPADDAGPDTRIDSARACSLLGISRKTFLRLCKKHHIAFLNVGGKYTFRTADIRQLIRDRSNREKPGNAS